MRQITAERVLLALNTVALFINAIAVALLGVAILLAGSDTPQLLAQAIDEARPTTTPTATVMAAPILPTAIPTAAATAVPTPTLKPTRRTGIDHTVASNQTLWEIARLYYGSGQAWPTLLEHNPDIGGRDELKPGDTVFVPRPDGGLPNVVTTPAPPEIIPIRASWYTLEDIGLSDAENVNCNDDCSNLALARFDPRMYDRVVACPQEWIGTSRTAKLTVSGLGDFYCLDTGTLITLTYREVSGYGREPLWVYEVDFLRRSEPVWHGALFYDWSITWIPTEQARREAVGE